MQKDTVKNITTDPTAQASGNTTKAPADGTGGTIPGTGGGTIAGTGGGTIPGTGGGTPGGGGGTIPGTGGGTPGGGGGTTDGGADDTTAKVKVHVDAIAAILKVPANFDPTKKHDKPVNPYGKQITAFGIGAAMTVQGCPIAFARYGGLADRLNNDSSDYIVQSNVRVLLTNLIGAVAYMQGVTNEQLVRDIALTINIRDTTMNNRGGDPQIQGQMDKASTLLQQLRSGRAAGKTTKIADTKTSSSALIDANNTITKQGVQIKYLNGQPLTPDDVVIQSPVAAPRKKQRSTKTPTPAATTPASSTPAPTRKKRTPSR